MATIKHTSSKNSDLTAPEHYLTFQHNEYTGLPLLDENGQPKLREEYLLDTLECSGQSFAMACLLANRKYGKNFSPDDVKTHQYIISFDPRDAADNGLTLEKAQDRPAERHRRTDYRKGILGTEARPAPPRPRQPEGSCFRSAHPANQI